MIHCLAVRQAHLLLDVGLGQEARVHVVRQRLPIRVLEKTRHAFSLARMILRVCDG